MTGRRRDAPRASRLVVPGSASSFVGRTDDIARLERLVRSSRLVSVVGPGGSGKTRLVGEVLRTGSFPLSAFVELAPVRPGGAIAMAVLASCGIRDDPGRSPVDRLCDQLRGNSGVLVLDNCEQVRDEVAELTARLLRDCPTLTVLATSRVTLGVTGETVVALSGLASDEDAVALFRARAGAVQPALSDGPEADAAARRICRLADGLPLAIELAAAHARALALPDIEAGMTNRLGFLTSRDPSALPQHRSLVASIGWSAELVGEPSRRALTMLSLFGGRFTLDAALAVLGPDGRAAIEVLVDHCLLQFHTDDGRYLLPDTIRDFAAAELDTADRARSRARLIAWAAGFARGASADLGRADIDALRRVERDDAAVSSALDCALDDGTGVAEAAGIVVDLAFAWSLRVAAPRAGGGPSGSRPRRMPLRRRSGGRWRSSRRTPATWRRGSGSPRQQQNEPPRWATTGPGPAP